MEIPPPKRPSLRTVLDVVTTLVLLVAAGAVLLRFGGPSAASGAGAPPSLLVPKERVSIEGAPFKGSAEAKYALIEFSDFECPYCSRFANDVGPQIEAKYVKSGKLALVFIHLPLPIHKNAFAAAEAAECGNRQGAFWPIHDRLFRLPSLEPQSVRAAAAASEIEMTKFDACVIGEAKGKVQADADLAKALSLTGTPAFFFGTLEPGLKVRVTAGLSGARPFGDFEEMLKPVLR